MSLTKHKCSAGIDGRTGRNDEVNDAATFGWHRKFFSGGMVINARAETVQTRPLFRGAFAAHRCVIPANGFYEWEKMGNKRLPWYFTSTKHPIFGLAGLYEPASDKQPAGFVILTTAPNDKVAPLVRSRRGPLRPEKPICLSDIGSRLFCRGHFLPRRCRIKLTARRRDRPERSERDFSLSRHGVTAYQAWAARGGQWPTWTAKHFAVTRDFRNFRAPAGIGLVGWFTRRTRNWVGGEAIARGERKSSKAFADAASFERLLKNQALGRCLGQTTQK